MSSEESFFPTLSPQDQAMIVSSGITSAAATAHAPQLLSCLKMMNASLQRTWLTETPVDPSESFIYTKHYIQGKCALVLIALREIGFPVEVIAVICTFYNSLLPFKYTDPPHLWDSWTKKIPDFITTCPKKNIDALIDSVERAQRFSTNPYFVHHNQIIHSGQDLWLTIETDLPLIELVNLLENGLKPEEIAYFTREALIGLKYLHDLGSAHGSFSCDCIYVSFDGQVKLTEAFYSDSPHQISPKGGCLHIQSKSLLIGTPYWMAPEQIMQETSMKSDIWSVGIFIAEMVEREPILLDFHPLKALFLIATQNPQLSLSTTIPYPNESHSLVCSCLQMEPEKRPNVDTLLEHPFLSISCDNKHIQLLLKSQ